MSNNNNIIKYILNCSKITKINKKKKTLIYFYNKLFIHNCVNKNKGL